MQQSVQIKKFVEACSESIGRPPQYILFFLQNQKLTIDLELLLSSDIRFIILLFKFVHLKVLEIQRSQPQKTSRKLQSKTLTHHQFLRFVKELAHLLHKQLSCLSLVFRKVLLGPAELQLIAQTLQESGVKELVLSQCKLNGQSLQLFFPSLLNTRINTLELSKNGLQGVGSQIKSMISAFNSRREQLKWINSIRGIRQNIQLQGLIEINLADNSLNSEDCALIFESLVSDRWIRSLNLRRNSICEKGMQVVSNTLDCNESLLSVDIRDNPGFNQTFSHQIFNKLKRNLHNLKAKKQQKLRPKTARHSFNSSQRPEVLQSSVAACQNCKALEKLISEKDKEIAELRLLLNQKRNSSIDLLDKQFLSQLSSISIDLRNRDFLPQLTYDRLEGLINNLTRFMDSLDQHTQQQPSFQHSSINNTIQMLGNHSNSLSLGIPRELSTIQTRGTGGQQESAISETVQEESRLMQFQQHRFS